MTLLSSRRQRKAPSPLGSEPGADERPRPKDLELCRNSYEANFVFSSFLFAINTTFVLPGEVKH